MVWSEGAGQQLVETIYNCALGLSDWDAVCRTLSAELPGAGIALHMHDDRHPTNVGVHTAGYDPSAVSDYTQHFVSLNPWLPSAPLMPAGLLHHSEDVVPLADMLGSEFWNDWLKPQGEFASGSRVILTHDGGRHAFLAINYTHRTAGPREKADELMRLAAPHVQRAFMLWQHTRFEPMKRSTLGAVLDGLRVPIIVVHCDRSVVYANRRGEKLLRDLDGMSIDADRSLHLMDGQADDRLGKALAEQARSPQSLAPLIVARKADRATGGARRFVVSAMPLPGDEGGVVFAQHTFANECLVALVVNDIEPRPAIPAEVLAEGFGLTDAEAEVAAALLVGRTLSEYAEEKGGSRYTARNQLASTLSKTGMARQADLIALLSRLSVST